MKQLSLLFLCALLSFACGDKEISGNTPTADPVIDITSETTIWFESEGGEGEITYTIENLQKGVSLTAESSFDWISNIIVGDSITYTVEENTTFDERHGTIELKYGKVSRIVTIKQHSSCDVEYTATTTSGSLYYGGSGVYCYTVVLSTEGLNESGYLQPNSTYYYFDLYSSIPAQGNMATIPNGTYRQRYSSTFRDGDIDPDYTNLTITDDYDYEEKPFSKAEVVVTDNNIKAIVTLFNGECHLITYSGSLEIPRYDTGQGGGGNTGSGLSTLLSDYTFNIEDGVFVGAWVGDLLGNGYDTCQVYMYEELDEVTGEEFGDTFQIDLQLPLGATDICGTYTHGTTVGHFIPGTVEDIDGQYLQQNSWYITAGYIDFAPLVSGSVTVEKDETNLYTFTIDTVDDKGNAIKGVFKGRGEFIEW